MTFECENCKTPLTTKEFFAWLPQYQEWFCKRCTSDFILGKEEFQKR